MLHKIKFTGLAVLASVVFLLGSTAGAYVLPTEGLLLHLDGQNAGNTAGEWKDSSGNNNHATMTGTTFTSGVGYTFAAANESGGVLGTALQPQSADKFAYFIRLTPGTPEATAGTQRLLGSDNAWNAVQLEYSNNNSVTWSVQNRTEAFVDDPAITHNPTHFRNRDNGINIRGIATELSIGITWEANDPDDEDFPGAYYGTARLYHNGQLAMTVANAFKPTTTNAQNDGISHIGQRSTGSTFFDGQIVQVALYTNYSGTSDDLMFNLHNSTIPEPASAMLLGAAGLLLLPRRRLGL